MGSVLCEHCAATCCRYLALPIDKPTNTRDYDDIRWYLLHAGVTVFVEDGDWYIQYQTACKLLGEDNLCTIYETRPEICREYEADGCDYPGGTYGYDHHFTHAKQIEAYYFEKTGKKLGTPEPAKKSKRPKSPRKKKTG